MRPPFTIDGREVPVDAPRSEGMDDPTAQAVSDAAEDFRSVAMHLHADVADYDVTLTASNCRDGTVGFSFGDGSFDTEERVTGGTTPEVTHTYLSDGTYTATLRHENGDRAFLELQIPTPPEEVVP
jgi:PKD domain-containing protein